MESAQGECDPNTHVVVERVSTTSEYKAAVALREKRVESAAPKHGNLLQAADGARLNLRFQFGLKLPDAIRRIEVFGAAVREVARGTEVGA